MSLVIEIENRMDRYSPSDPQWVQFVQDHRALLINTAIEVPISPEETFHRRYRPETLLKNIGVPEQLTWIVLMINDLTDPKDFLNLRSLLVFEDETVLSRLYASYTTWIENLRTSQSRLSE